MARGDHLRGKPPVNGFKKGVSGNPSGRPKQVREVAALARKCTEAAIATLAKIMIEGDNESARVRAAEILLDRAWGRAPQAVHLTGGLGHTLMSPDEARKILGLD